MPIYEYHCQACDHDFERLVFSAAAERELKCPECQSGNIEKQFSSFCGRTQTEGGGTRSLSSGCSGCHASSCAGCR